MAADNNIVDDDAPLPCGKHTHIKQGKHAVVDALSPAGAASGAGAATQHSVGTGILGGMLAATLVGVFFTPLFYYVVSTWFGGRRAKAPTPATPREGGHP